MSLDGIREHLAYDPETGVFTWLTESKYSPRKIGDRAGAARSDGRRVICWRGKSYLSYRLAWWFAHGEMPVKGLDHVNGDPTDDRLENLRPAGQAENMLNIKAHKDSTSSFKGVCWDRGAQKWRVGFRGRYVGIFANEVDAAHAYDRAALAHNPRFSRLNFG